MAELSPAVAAAVQNVEDANKILLRFMDHMSSNIARQSMGYHTPDSEERKLNKEFLELCELQIKLCQALLDAEIEQECGCERKLVVILPARLRAVS